MLFKAHLVLALEVKDQVSNGMFMDQDLVNQFMVGNIGYYTHQIKNQAMIQILHLVIGWKKYIRLCQNQLFRMNAYWILVR